MTGDRRALVLGGGGVTGVAWEIGLLYGLAEHGLDLTGADLFVGTSAGSVVAAQVTTGNPLEHMYAAQRAAATGEIAARIGVGFYLRFAVAGLWPGDRRQARARIGRAALRARTAATEAERRAVIARRIETDEWPDQRLLIPAVAAESGETKVFDKDSGVSLVDAVAASCAVPLVWPPMTVNGTRYVDGGVRSVANVDLAKGHERVVVIAPMSRSARRAGRPDAQAAALGPGVRSVVVGPDAAAVTAIGPNALDPGRRAPAAEAGRAQAAAAVARIREVWT
ncbi:NTE family protein [Krasilnikovia cinnamomea]|uniref:NTE family protein n=1 Tax=Krasilnikovia cinnamomea TaxID=349313 RepID=A0A4Q7ZEN9_9ACTN|nr:patatin-like phospholipase family protein [Krasilnikovia cinnamomea]RZU49167.1 NTE family protein [Krasilnikovia cinnamomea]